MDRMKGKGEGKGESKGESNYCLNQDSQDYWMDRMKGETSGSRMKRMNG